ncbi:calcium-binding protein [Streptomyces sp. NPDC015184]|uniref:calcium-binding protein n=1 Tax=Streptomyces sp. NPDC015184 TaxID=3364946 RepID=UPI003700F244
MGALDRAEPEAMVEEATVDAYGKEERRIGLFTLLEQCLDLPFTATVLGVEVTVRGAALTRDGRLVASCSRGRVRQSIGILDLPLPSPAPERAEWIETYRHWAG